MSNEDTDPVKLPEIPPPWPVKKQLSWGVVALVLWVHVFSAGVLIDSLPSRMNLGWEPEASARAQIINLEDRVIGLENEKAVGDRKGAPGVTSKPAKTSMVTSTAGTDDNQSILGNTAPEKAKQEPQGSTISDDASKWDSYFLATLTFMPVNVAILTVLAAFLGGCSASPQFVRDVEARLRRIREEGGVNEELESRLHYLNEHPAFSAFRGLIVYLVIASGLFVFAGSETFTSVPDQTGGLTRYIRYASIFSVFGYMAGHDPTVFTSLLSLVGKRVQQNTPETNPKNPR
jgi:hypothetical protein